MKLCIFGYGNMGKELEEQAIVQGLKISKIVGAKDKVEYLDFDDTEIILDFSTAEAFLRNLPLYAKKGVNVVCGTTDWYEHLGKVKDIVQQNDIGFLYSANFAVGVHLFWNIIKNAASLMNKRTDYDIMGYEIHHKTKQDSPSGTAKYTSEILLENIDRKNTLITETLHRPIKQNEIHFSSIRGGNAFGHHKVIFDSMIDTIAISHIAKDRTGFAKGAIEAARWLEYRKGFYSIEDFLGDLL